LNQPCIPREERAEGACRYIHSRFTSKQQIILDFILQHYVTIGMQELAQEKLTPLLMPWPIWGTQKKSPSSFQASRNTFIRHLPDPYLVHEGLSPGKESANNPIHLNRRRRLAGTPTSSWWPGDGKRCSMDIAEIQINLRLAARLSMIISERTASRSNATSP
jgi:hypothetical protein